jgi:hypothetical protein
MIRTSEPYTSRLAWALALTAFLRLPSFAWPVISDDEGIYDSMAQVVNHGGIMYREALDHHPPGSVYIYAWTERWLHASIGGVHAVGLVFAVLTSLGLYLIARELMKKELAWLPPLLYGIVSTAKCAYDGLAFNGEMQMNLPAIFAVWAVLRADGAGQTARARRAGLDLLAGALVGLAGLAKWQALVMGLAFPFFVAGGSGREGWLRRALTRGPFWLLGLTLPLGAAALFFRANGMLADAWRWGGVFNMQYIAEGPGLAWALQRLGTQLAAVVLPSAVFYWAGLSGLAKNVKSESPGSFGLFVWTTVSFLAIAIGGRFFGHYFLQAELPLCLLAAAPLARAFERMPKLVAAATAVPALFFLVVGSIPSVTHAIFDPGEPDWATVGGEIARQSAPEETLFVWGNIPPLYSLSGRRMGTRFTYCNYLTGLSPGTPSEYDPKLIPTTHARGAWPLLLEDLENRRPTLVLDTAAAGWKGYGKFPVERFPALKGYLAAHYKEQARIDGAVLYRRTP